MGPDLVEITVWSVLQKEGWQHNHIEMGHVKTNTPTPFTEEQGKVWGGRKWNRKHTYATSGKPMVVRHDPSR